MRFWSSCLCGGSRELRKLVRAGVGHRAAGGDRIKLVGLGQCRSCHCRRMHGGAWPETIIVSMPGWPCCLTTVPAATLNSKSRSHNPATGRPSCCRTLRDTPGIGGAFKFQLFYPKQVEDELSKKMTDADKGRLGRVWVIMRLAISLRSCPIWQRWRPNFKLDRPSCQRERRVQHVPCCS